MKKKRAKYKEPELIIDGDKIKFHSSRAERLIRSTIKPVKFNEPFLSKKNRYLHIMILNFFLIFIMGMIISTIYGNSKSFTEDGFYYTLIKRKTFSQTDLYFNFMIKNILKEENLIKYSDYDFILYDSDNRKIYQKSNIILKQIFKSNDKYADVFLVQRPGTGNYRSVIIFNDNVKINMNFKL